MRGKPVPGKHVMILDGDGHFMGLALAEFMVNQGKDMTYLCDAIDVAEYGVFTMESFNNMRMLCEKGIETYCNHWVDRIEAGSVRARNLYKLGPDLIGPTSGAVPRKLEWPAQLTQVIWDAHRLAREIDSPHPAYPLPWIRERQLWGAVTVPKLGDTRVNVEASK